MIQIKCPLQTGMQLKDMNPLQGVLKHRTQGDINSLRISLQQNGLLMPFVIWNKYIIDGHGRYTALSQMAQTDLEVAETSWPVIEIQAATIEEARQGLLEINAKYGKITPKGLEAFLRESPVVKVPTSLGVSIPKSLSLPSVESKPKTHALLKLRIPKEYVAEFTAIIKELSYVEIA